MEETSSRERLALVVEDEPLVRTMAAAILSDAGYCVLEACDAQHALTILESRPEIDMVLTDVEMPGPLNGIGLALAIHDRWPGTIIVVNSGRCRPETAALPVGAGFIAKPWRSRDLLAEIDASAARSRAQTRG